MEALVGWMVVGWVLAGVLSLKTTRSNETECGLSFAAASSPGQWALWLRSSRRAPESHQSRHQSSPSPCLAFIPIGGP